jgi:hypothetical protein
VCDSRCSGIELSEGDNRGALDKRHFLGETACGRRESGANRFRTGSNRHRFPRVRNEGRSACFFVAVILQIADDSDNHAIREPSLN